MEVIHAFLRPAGISAPTDGPPTRCAFEPQLQALPIKRLFVMNNLSIFSRYLMGCLTASYGPKSGVNLCTRRVITVRPTIVLLGVVQSPIDFTYQAGN